MNKNDITTDNSLSRLLAVTHFQPIFARYALPCFDEPEFKAVFTVSLTHPKCMKALSNGAIIRHSELEYSIFTMNGYSQV